MVNVGKSSFHVSRLWMLRYFGEKSIKFMHTTHSYIRTCTIRCLASHLISFHLELMVLIVDVAAAAAVVYIQATDCFHSFWKILDFIAFASFHLFPFHIIICVPSARLFFFSPSSSSPFSFCSLHFSEMTKHRQAPVWLEDYGLLQTLAETSIWIQ